MEWMILPLKRYFDFSGRSRRKEYWMYTLFLILVSIVLAFIDIALGLGTGPDGTSSGLLGNIFSLATLIPSIAVGVRRLHDLDRSGWWILLPLGPILVGVVLLGVGFATAMGGLGGGGMSATMILGILAMVGGVIASIVLLVWYCTPGTVGPNRFGEDPKNPAGDVEQMFG